MLNQLATITCPECGRTSHHPEDVKHGYCGNCHTYRREGPYVNSLRVTVEVVAGLIPGKDPEPEFTRQWHITGDEWAAAGAKQSDLLAELNGRAQGYAMLLMLQPDRLNWVRTDWIWW